MKPPVTIDILMKEWSSDSIIDATSMEKEVLKISHLHGKYLNVMSYHRHLLRKLDTEYKSMKGIREEYFSGHLTQEECDKYGWEYMQHVHSNPKIARLLETDPELTKILLKKKLQDLIVEQCDLYIKELNGRNFALRGVIDNRRFLKGND